MSKDPIEMFGKSTGASQAAQPRPASLRPPEFMKRLAGRFGLLRRGGLKVAVVLAIMLYFFGNSLFVYVRPNEYGILVNKLVTPRGVQKGTYEAGLHFVMPFGMQEMHRLPRDIQVLELTNSPDTAAQSSRMVRAAHIQTSDGFFVDVDVSILYHIADPYLVFTTIGPGTLYQDNGIIPKTEPALKESLGELTTEEFYNSLLRVKRVNLALELLNRELNPKGMAVDQVLIRYFSYSEEIQKNIEEKKLKDQLVFKNQAEARAATEGANFKKVTQEGEMLVAVKISEGEAYVTRRKAEKDLYTRTKRAEADLLIRLAEAKKTELRNTALQGLGSDRMVGLEMADALKGLDIVVLPSDGKGGVNPLDLNSVLTLFGVREGGGNE